MPTKNMNGKVIHTSTRPDCTAANMRNSIGMSTSCTPRISRLRSNLSLITPAKKPPSSIGTKKSAPTTWFRTGESAIWVSR